jgi:hypothetical protein
VIGLKNYFIGDAFEDSLFNTDNEQREKACSWKIQSNTLLFSGLTNEYWRWRAVGIPLDLSDKSLEGDIDLMFAMRHRSQDRDGPARFANIYRGFELKTAKVKKSGEVKSLKDGRFKKTIAQLQKLCDFGLPQVFLLEAFIVEAGYSPASKGRMPTEVRNSVANKRAQIENKDFGYVALAIEQIPGYSEAHTGVLWPGTTVKEAKTNPLRPPFSRLVSTVEEFAEKNGAIGGRSVVTFCYRCRNLTAVVASGPYVCTNCKTPLIL